MHGITKVLYQACMVQDIDTEIFLKSVVVKLKRQKLISAGCTLTQASQLAMYHVAMATLV